MSRKGRPDRVWVDMARLDTASRPLLVDRLVGRPGYRPFLLVVVAALFIGVALLPVPGGLVDMMSVVDPSGYHLAPGTKTIVDTVNYHTHPEAFEAVEEGGRTAVAAQGLDSAEQVARRAMIMLGILFAAAMLWGIEALPIGGTVIVVAVLMFLFGVLPTHEVPNAFVNDAVFFIIGILAVAVGAFAFIFFPLLAVLAGFLSEHALVAFLVPVMMGVYKATCDVHGVKQDRVLAIFLLLGICFAANVGGPASPAAGARNAIMVGYLADAGVPISFWEWMKYGMPLVPVLALTVGAYMYLRCKPKLIVKDFNPSEAVKRQVAGLPRFGGQEAIMAAILGALIIAWITLYDTFGLGGATLAAVSAMFLLGIIRWRDVQRGVAFDVVGLYAAASAIAVGLSFTGGGLWLANEVVGVLPRFLSEGTGLVMGVSIVTGILTNFMSDGATVGVLGPIALPMAELGDVSLWKVGLIVSFASSFANVLVVGTPNNAIAFAMSKDPETGKRLLSVFDFVRYGLPLTILLLLVMWGWALFGYWSILSWP